MLRALKRFKVLHRKYSQNYQNTLLKKSNAKITMQTFVERVNPKFFMLSDK